MIISSYYGRILQVFTILRENNYLPSMYFLLLKFPIKNCFWGRTFLIVNRFSKFLQHILGQTKRQILPWSSISRPILLRDSTEEIICIQLKEIEDIPENHYLTLDFGNLTLCLWKN